MARRLERLGLPVYEPTPIPSRPGAPDPTIQWIAARTFLWTKGAPLANMAEDVDILESMVWLEGKTSEGTKTAYLLAWRSETLRPSFFRNWAELIGMQAPGAPLPAMDPADEVDDLEALWQDWRMAQDRRDRATRRNKARSKARRAADRGRNAWGTATVRTSGFRPEES